MKALIGAGGPLEGRQFEQLYSTQDEDDFGEVGGRIGNLTARYIREVKDGIIEGKLNNHWKIIGIDTKSSERQDVVDLINLGILEVPKTEDGKYTNVASINIKRSGEFYKALNRMLKDKDKTISIEKPIEEKPIEQSNIKEKEIKEEIYTVKSGDVLWKIASKFQKTWQEITEYNNLRNPHLIFPGQKLIILIY